MVDLIIAPTLYFHKKFILCADQLVLAQCRKFGYTVFVIFCFAIKSGAIARRFGIKEAER